MELRRHATQKQPRQLPTSAMSFAVLCTGRTRRFGRYVLLVNRAALLSYGSLMPYNGTRRVVASSPRRRLRSRLLAPLLAARVGPGLGTTETAPPPPYPHFFFSRPF